MPDLAQVVSAYCKGLAGSRSRGDPSSTERFRLPVAVVGPFSVPRPLSAVHLEDMEGLTELRAQVHASVIAHRWSRPRRRVTFLQSRTWQRSKSLILSPQLTSFRFRQVQGVPGYGRPTPCEVVEFLYHLPFLQADRLDLAAGRSLRGCCRVTRVACLPVVGTWLGQGHRVRGRDLAVGHLDRPRVDHQVAALIVRVDAVGDRPPGAGRVGPAQGGLSVTAVSAGTLRVAPVRPPPERVVVRLVDAAGRPYLLDLAAGALGGGVRPRLPSSWPPSSRSLAWSRLTGFEAGTLPSVTSTVPALTTRWLHLLSE